MTATLSLYDALFDCVKRLRACARLSGNAAWAIDSMCEPYEAALLAAQGIEARQGGDGTAPREARKPDPKGCAQND